MNNTTKLYPIEFGFPVWKDEDEREERSDFLPLPFIPREGEKLAWNNNIYLVTDVMYSLITRPNPDLEATDNNVIQHLGYKVWLRLLDNQDFDFIQNKNFQPIHHDHDYQFNIHKMTME